MSDEHECHCYHPFKPKELLKLCGSDLCKHLTSKLRNGSHRLQPIVLEEDDKNAN